MFIIFNERKQFWQWDTGQRLIVDDDVCPEIHFCNGTNECALVCKVYEKDGIRLVDVPNILLQSAKTINVFAYIRDENEQYTKRSQAFFVMPRTKPSDYVYTETEVLNYYSLDERLKRVETGGGAINGIPPGGKAGQYLRKQSDDDYDAAWSDIEIPEQYGLVSYDQDKRITIT